MEKLFGLIKSLNGMEKRYFKLAVSVHGENTIEKLHAPVQFHFKTKSL
jgi:hypothetical protein